MVVAHVVDPLVDDGLQELSFFVVEPLPCVDTLSLFALAFTPPDTPILPPPCGDGLFFVAALFPQCTLSYH